MTYGHGYYRPHVPGTGWDWMAYCGYPNKGNRVAVIYWVSFYRVCNPHHWLNRLHIVR